MIQLNLTDIEASTLSTILMSYLSDLRMEIADTEQIDFRERLKQDEVLIKKILETLAEPLVSDPGPGAWEDEERSTRL